MIRLATPPPSPGIFAPLATRIGMYSVASELENLAFAQLQPTAAAAISAAQRAHTASPALADTMRELRALLSAPASNSQGGGPLLCAIHIRRASALRVWRRHEALRAQQAQEGNNNGSQTAQEGIQNGSEQAQEGMREGLHQAKEGTRNGSQHAQEGGRNGSQPPQAEQPMAPRPSPATAALGTPRPLSPPANDSSLPALASAPIASAIGVTSSDVSPLDAGAPDLASATSPALAGPNSAPPDIAAPNPASPDLSPLEASAPDVAASSSAPPDIAPLDASSLALGDLVRLVLVCASPLDCYTALGILHQRYRSVGGFKDYISTPKPNYYQSLHTRVLGPGGQMIQLIIRTQPMHQVAEQGIIAYWRQQEGQPPYPTPPAQGLRDRQPPYPMPNAPGGKGGPSMQPATQFWGEDGQPPYPTPPAPGGRGGQAMQPMPPAPGLGDRQPPYLTPLELREAGGQPPVPSLGGEAGQTTQPALQAPGEEVRPSMQPSPPAAGGEGGQPPNLNSKPMPPVPGAEELAEVGLRPLPMPQPTKSGRRYSWLQSLQHIADASEVSPLLRARSQPPKS